MQNPAGMTSNQRDFFVSRIIAGYVVYKEESLKIYHPNKDVEYLSNIAYLESFEEAREKNIYTDEDILTLLLNNGWSKQKEKSLETLPHLIEDIQVDLYQATVNLRPIKDKLRIELNLAKKNLDTLFMERHQFDIFTCHGAGLQTKHQYCIAHSAFSSSGLADWNLVSLAKVITYFNNNILQPELIRYLARTTPWANIWQSAKVNGTIFDKPGVELTKEQQLILFWSKLYDNVQEAQEVPSSEVINDDDLMDGWLILQRRGNEGHKIKDLKGSEVFLPVKNQEEANKIFDLNKDRERNIIKNRLKQVEEQGEVKYHEFKDVKQRVAMERMQARKG